MVIVMRMMCAWCGDEIGEASREDEESHGICLPCVAVHFPGMEAAVAGQFNKREKAENDGLTEIETSRRAV